MAAWEPYDVLPVVAPDIGIALEVPPQVEIVEAAGKDQQIHRAADGVSHERIGFSDDSLFRFELQFEFLSASDAGSILDHFHEIAEGFVYSFPWTHPVDGHTYIVRYGAPAPRTLFPDRYTAPGITLIVLGRSA
jgi:hypothetical protein